MSKFGIFGASGRVGGLLIDTLKNDSNEIISSIYSRSTKDFGVEGAIITSDIDEFLNNCEIVIDFSLPEALEKLLEVALNNHKPLVIGTTGLNKHQQNLVKEASLKMPILYATNMSLGVAMLNKLVEIASKSLRNFDCEIVEMHHKFKKDAPSGTALTLAHTAAKARELELDDVMVSGRNGNIGERSNDEISVMALRGGDIVGKHTVGFYSDGEFIELTHTATNRTTFSNGAIRAAKWLIGKPAGLYTISDCLGI
jgi:4-hydroxy-tetrahydrodipicolinate reductase